MIRRTVVIEGDPDSNVVQLAIVERTDECSRGRIVGHVPLAGCSCGGCWLLCEKDDPARESTVDDIPVWRSP